MAVVERGRLRSAARAYRGSSRGGEPDTGHASGSRESIDLTRLFVDEVSWFMTENKITRADLAQSMGVSPGRVSQILSGDENLTLRTLSSVLTAVGATPEVILNPVDGPSGE